MDNLWRFYNGVVSGVVVAETEQEAIALAGAYLGGHFDEKGLCSELIVWPCIQDDDYDEDFPHVLAVSY